MPPRKRLEATVFLVDCSSNIDKNLDLLYKISAVTYFNQTSSAGKDIQKVILYNKKVTVVNDWSVYALDRLKEVQTVANKYLENDNKSKSVSLFHVIEIALEALNDDLVTHHVKRIVVISQLTEALQMTDKIQKQMIILKRELSNTKDTWLYIIGPDVKLPKLQNRKDIEKCASLTTFKDSDNSYVLQKLLKGTNIIVADAVNGLHLYFAHKVNQKPSYPWKVEMNIGKDIFIPITAYKSIKHPQPIHLCMTSMKTNKAINMDKKWFDVNSHQLVTNENVVHGYKFHGKFVTMSREQTLVKEQMKKCLTVFAFAKRDNVHINLYMMSDSMNVIKPDPKSNLSNESFNLFATGLKVNNVVALAYRVYNTNCGGRKLFGIFPCPDHHGNGHLLMCQLPYEHELVEKFVRGAKPPQISSPTLKETTLQNLVNSFLSSMTVHEEVLPNYMTLNENRTRKAYIIAKKNLGMYQEDAPQLKPDSDLINNARPSAEQIAQLLNSD